MFSQHVKKLASVIAVSTLLLPAVALADVKVGYVDLERALSESVAGQKAKKNYEVEVKKAQAAIDQKKTQFEDKQRAFEKQKDNLNQKAAADKAEELMGVERDLKRAFRDSQESLRRKNAVLVGDLLKKMREAVADIGKKNDFTVILEKGSQAVLYADASIDVTDEVVKRFNELTR